ncbi:unannotated protein [freshwater metagenome]|uniref:Unannotated protein n=1 Tax=freshwater metagenome TaxID=449393 RepID=A0A6J6EX69_9ZZZZ
MVTQRLELVWPGKDKFLLVPKDESGKPVWVEPDHPAAREVRLSDFTAEHGEVSEDDPYGDNRRLSTFLRQVCSGISESWVAPRRVC